MAGHVWGGPPSCNCKFTLCLEQILTCKIIAGRGQYRVFSRPHTQWHYRPPEQEQGGQLLLAQDQQDLLQGEVLHAQSQR